MTKIPGTNIAASIVPFDTLDTYATHQSKYGQGGWHEVTDLIERDNIPQERRSIGMAVYVQEDDTIYLLKDGTSNNHWKALNTGGTSTTYTHTQGIASQTWLIIHNLGKKPSITIVDSADSVVEGEIQYVDENRALVTFKSAFKGKAYCN
jgi:hypothetical protein